MPRVHLLDYVAGNVRSLVNAVEKLGYEVEWIERPDDIKNAEVIPALQPYSSRSVLYTLSKNQPLTDS